MWGFVDLLASRIDTVNFYLFDIPHVTKCISFNNSKLGYATVHDTITILDV